MTYFTIETTPQFQPGACFITGKHEDDWFVRLPCADASPFGSILISATGFRQLATDLGFAPKDAQINLLESLKEKMNELGPALSLVGDELRTARNSLLPIEEVLRRVSDLSSNLGEVAGALASAVPEDDGAEHVPSEPTPEPQLAGILESANRKRTPGTDRKGEPGRSLFSDG